MVSQVEDVKALMRQARVAAAQAPPDPPTPSFGSLAVFRDLVESVHIT
jgi:hypothetical protein